MGLSSRGIPCHLSASHWLRAYAASPFEVHLLSISVFFASFVRSRYVQAVDVRLILSLADSAREVVLRVVCVTYYGSEGNKPKVGCNDGFPK